MPTYTLTAAGLRWRATFARALTVAEQEAIAAEVEAARPAEPEALHAVAVETLERWRRRVEREGVRP